VLLTEKPIRAIHPTQQDNSVDIVEESRAAKLFVNGAAVAAGVATKSALEALWRTTRDEEPPNNPAAPDVSWRDALIWAASVGAAMGVAKVLSRRGTTEAWRKWRT